VSQGHGTCKDYSMSWKSDTHRVPFSLRSVIRTPPRRRRLSRERAEKKQRNEAPGRRFLSSARSRVPLAVTDTKPQSAAKPTSPSQAVRPSLRPRMSTATVARHLPSHRARSRRDGVVRCSSLALASVFRRRLVVGATTAAASPASSWGCRRNSAARSAWTCSAVWCGTV
jgi:hypothetical protein